ncbi:hypothetical protein mRhiFer1_008537 [Rhinolophus ferrumequinum]|uniref:Uncharacterized protein n=1 Tax=Rhinolophus ferrumequinum TaxID=59479 RepID=A0A7J7UX35_RHIFE|nr:hypothetical protein mRhiFer1_008537 [Rhinolophus ferrumequinum]
MGSFELDVLATAPPTLTSTHAYLHSNAPLGPRARKAGTGTALSPPGRSCSQVVGSRRELLGSQERPGITDPQYFPGLKFKMPTISWSFFLLDRAALVQVNCECGARRSPHAPASSPARAPPGGTPLRA